MTADVARARVVFPDTDLSVSRVALGGNRFGSELDDAATCVMLDRFVELGGNLVDTAHVYADWLPDLERSCSEKAIGRWLRSRGADGRDVVVATKGAHPDVTRPDVRRLDPDSIRDDASRSRENLGLGTIPLYYLHRDDPAVPVGEILDALGQLRNEGVVANYAASNWTAARLSAALAYARAAGIPGFVAEQSSASLAATAPGKVPADMVALGPALDALHKRTGLPLVAYSAQGKGYFDKAVDGFGRVPPEYDVSLNRETAGLVDGLARGYGVSPVQLALRSLWLLPYPVVAVVGPRTLDQLDSSWAALDIPLTQEHATLLLGRLQLAVESA